MKASKTLVHGLLAVVAIVSAQPAYAAGSSVVDLVKPTAGKGQAVSFSAQGRQQFDYVNNPMLHYKAVKGMKFPAVYVLNRMTHTVEVFGLVRFSPFTNRAMLITSPEHLADMKVSEYKAIFAEVGLKLHKKFDGAREAFMAKVVESTLNSMSLFSHYKGSPLVDQYRLGIPQRWTLSSPAELEATVKFLKNKFGFFQIKPLETRPPLLIDILKNGNQVSPETVAFLNNYYDLVDARDEAVAKFYGDAHDHLMDYLSKDRDAKVVGESVIDTLMRTVDENMKGLDAQKLALAAVTGYITVNALKDPLNKMIFGVAQSKTPTDEFIAKHRKELLIGLGTVAATLVTLKAYEVYEEHQDSVAQAAALEESLKA